jgi:hydrogenase 3 maturation protease
MNLLVGIGNEMRSDDGAGPWAAKNFTAAGWQTLDCGILPENYTSKIKQLAPNRIVFLDATDLGIPPGEFRIVPKENIADLSTGTHNLPISLMMDFLSMSMDAEMLFIGIQPAVVTNGTGLSPEMFQGLEKLFAALRSESLLLEIPKALSQ